ncbi:unnamed protein product [Cuscuta campestris]|uniref:Uncharacterized protein n=1 Tax=Cuscuta campestris TaxID=132261 RepID=A0A484M062_9ASTE|nr:unnamed protein product [Cuscuta campestris]
MATGSFEPPTENGAGQILVWIEDLEVMACRDLVEDALGLSGRNSEVDGNPIRQEKHNWNSKWSSSQPVITGGDT